MAVGLMALCLGAATAGRAASPGMATTAGLKRFLAELRPLAEQQGIKGELFDATFASMTPDTSVAGLVRSQPEFNRPLGAYLAQQVTPGRVAAGQALRRRWAQDLEAIEHRFGVPPEIVVAVWGLESNYSASSGNKDVIRCLATLASIGYRPDLYRSELLTALRLLQSGVVSRQSLRGSWAGAMGQPQFMPSSFESYAADGNGDGRRDIWTSVPDALASIASFLQAKGWQAGRSWGSEVRMPGGFDYRTSRAANTRWASLGLARADGRPMPTDGASTLFFPAGAAGPGFLVTENYEVLKTYNFSDAYVMSVAELADQMGGGSPSQANWPLDPPMTRDDRIALQTRLVTLGYAVDNREGRISLALRDTIRAAQADVGLRPDGNPTPALLQALRALPAPDK